MNDWAIDLEGRRGLDGLECFEFTWVGVRVGYFTLGRGISYLE